MAQAPPKYVLHTEPFDFTANRKNAKPTNGLESTIHTIKTALGGGILGVHEGYMKCGLWTGVFFTLVFGFYIGVCTFTIVSSAHKLYKRLHLSQMSYPDVAEAAVQVGPFPKLRKYSKTFRYAVDVIICTNLFGACCVYEIIIAKTLQQVIGTNVHDQNTLRLYILALLVPIILLCMIRTLKYLAPFALIGNGFIVICVISTIVYSQQHAPPLSTMPAFKSFMGFFEFCGVVVFSMEGFGVTMPIENSMKKPKQYAMVITVGMTFIITLVGLVGFFGYWGFGEKSMAPVTLNFPADTFPTVLKVLVALMVYVTFALNFWAPFNLVWHYIKIKYDPNKYWITERVHRAVIIVILTGLAIAFPNIGNLMGLLGAFCVTSMGFIFPSIIELLVVWQNPGLGTLKWRLWKNIMVLVVGLLLFTTGTYSNARGLFASLTA